MHEYVKDQLNRQAQDLQTQDSYENFNRAVLGAGRGACADKYLPQLINIQDSKLQLQALEY